MYANKHQTSLNRGKKIPQESTVFMESVKFKVRLLLNVSNHVLVVCRRGSLRLTGDDGR